MCFSGKPMSVPTLMVDRQQHQRIFISIARRFIAHTGASTLSSVVLFSAEIPIVFQFITKVKPRIVSLGDRTLCLSDALEVSKYF